MDQEKEKKPVADGGNSKDKEDDESGDPDRKRMMQKFEGRF